MTLISEWRCWQIMQCDPEARCAAKDRPGEECWDVIGFQDPYAFNICRDCLVYVAKKKDAVLSREEIRSILARKGIELAEHPVPDQSVQTGVQKMTCAGREVEVTGRTPVLPERALQDPEAA